MSKNKKKQGQDGFENVEVALSKAEIYIEQNQKSLTIIILAIVAVVGLYMGYKRFYLEPKEKEAQSEMFIAEKYFEIDSFAIALEGDGQYLGFIDIIDEYGATKTANLANYYAGISYLRLGEYENAVEYLEDFDGNDRIVAAIALGATGDAYSELGEIKKAISYYEKASSYTENRLTTPAYLKKAGILYEELGQYKKAISTYKDIKKQFPDSEEAIDIQKYISGAELKL